LIEDAGSQSQHPAWAHAKTRNSKAVVKYRPK
jgi:hypothetical protein